MYFNDNFFSGGASPRSLRIVPATVQPQRAGIPGSVYASRHARDSRVCRARRHQCLHHCTRHGHEDFTHRR